MTDEVCKTKRQTSSSRIQEGMDGLFFVAGIVNGPTCIYQLLTVGVVLPCSPAIEYSWRSVDLEFQGLGTCIILLAPENVAGNWKVIWYDEHEGIRLLLKQ